nr:hypothetical protein [Tanacetum cinerariifolium]
MNNDLEYLRGGASSRKYTTSITKTKAADYGHIKWIEDLVPRAMWIQEPINYDRHALWGVSHWEQKCQQFYGFTVNRKSALDVYSKRRIIAVIELKIVEWHNYKHLDWISKSVSPDIHSSSYGDQTRKQGDKVENKDKGKSPIVTIIEFKDLNEEFEECINNSSNGVNAASSSVSAPGLNFTNSTNDFSAAGPSNTAMPNLEDLSHNADDVGAEADINNMESIILTRSMARAVRDQGRIS